MILLVVDAKRACRRMPTRALSHPWPFPLSAIPGRGIVRNVAAAHEEGAAVPTEESAADATAADLRGDGRGMRDVGGEDAGAVPVEPGAPGAEDRA